MTIAEADRLISDAWFRANASPHEKAAAIRYLMPIVNLCMSAVERDEWLKRIAERLGVDLGLLRRDGKIDPGPLLAPSDPDAFAAWAWEHGLQERGEGPVMVDDLVFDLGLARDVVEADFRRLAERVRENQRQGLDPWKGIR